jgi:hypothetical protein
VRTGRVRAEGTTDPKTTSDRTVVEHDDGAAGR